VSDRDVIAQTFAGYRAWGAYLVALALVSYGALGGLCLLLVLTLGELGFLGALALFAVGYAWVQGVLVDAIAATQEPDADLSLGARFAAVLPSVNTLSVAWLLASFGIGVGLVLLVVPGLVFMTWWALLVPAIVLERQGLFAAFARSRELVRGYGRAVFAVLLLTGILATVASFALERVVLLLPVPAGFSELLAWLVGASLVAPFLALATTVLFAELKGRRAAASTAFAPQYAPPPAR
jgi:hypothetical protein